MTSTFLIKPIVAVTNLDLKQSNGETSNSYKIVIAQFFQSSNLIRRDGIPEDLVQHPSWRDRQQRV
jgi:hypothetical protein